MRRQIIDSRFDEMKRKANGYTDEEKSHPLAADWYLCGCVGDCECDIMRYSLVNAFIRKLVVLVNAFIKETVWIKL